MINLQSKCFWGLRRCEAGVAAAFRRVQRWSMSWPLLLPAQRRLLARNRRLAGIHQGRRAFVVGNGPSLAKLDLTKLRGELVFTTNDFGCHPILDSWQPAAHALADGAYFSQPEAYAGVFQRVRDRLGASPVIMPADVEPAIRRHGLLPEERCYYVEFLGNAADFADFDFDLSRPVPGVQTVTILACMTALHMGCNPVYLIGQDLDFLASPKQKNHFAADYEKDAQGVPSYVDFEYTRLIDLVGKMFAGFVSLKRSAAKRGQVIYNASAGGFLDVFERVDYNSLFPTGPR